MLLPGEANSVERDLAKLADRVAFTSPDHIVVGRVALDDRVHCLDVIAGEAEVALDGEPAELQFATADDRQSTLVFLLRLRHSKMQGGDCMGDLLGYKRQRSVWTLVIEHDAGEQSQFKLIAIGPQHAV